MVVAFVEPEGEFIVPPEVMTMLALKKGDSIEFVEQDGRVLLRPVRA